MKQMCDGCFLVCIVIFTFIGCRGFVLARDELGSDNAGAAKDGGNVASEPAKKGERKKSEMSDNPPAFVRSDNQKPQLKLAVQDGDGLELATVSPQMQHIIIGSVCAGVAVIGIIIAVTCYCKFRQSESKNFASQRHDNGYATYGVTGPVSKGSFHFHEPGDRKLAQSAQMYHYQYQKQQMIDMEKANGEVKADATDEDNEAEEEDDVVYQTCGLASSADLQIPNPMFKGEDENGNAGEKVEPCNGGPD